LSQLFIKNRYGAFWLAILCIVAIAAATRVALILQNFSELADVRPMLFLALPLGVLYDLTVAAWGLLPFGIFLFAMRDRWLAHRGWYWCVVVLFFLWFFGALYLAVVEFYFFQEYNSRFNAVAVEYLSFPREILSNVWVSYPVLPVLAAVTLISLALVYFIRRQVKKSLAAPTSGRTRLLFLAAQVMVMFLGTLMLNPRSCRISDNRIVHEITMNGFYSFFNAALTYDLDFDSYYSRLDDTVACGRLRRMLQSDDVQFLPSPNRCSIDRSITPAGPPRKLNVVIILEESLGSQFIQSLSPDKTGVAPEFEKLADSGLLFTHIYATGTRTVRGLEATLLSLPPIPGQSIVRRPGGEHVFSLPSLLQENGYQTTFIYAGFSYYDNMKEFTLSNGIERVFDINDSIFKQRTYSTLWGLCDEDLFDNSLAVFDSLQQQGKPFFTLMLTVSNHSPFDYPKGRIPEDPAEHTRENAVKYADFALGKFLRDARSHPFFDSTLFVVLGDHGPRVYGPQRVPMDSYRIPILFYGPHVVPAGVRDSITGSQLDVSPTILGVLNLPYNSEFFGTDLRRLPRDQGRALMSLNRDVALYRHNHMAVLGVGQDRELWNRDPLTGKFSELEPSADQDLFDDAIAYYQSAYTLYQEHRLHPLAQPHPVTPNPTTTATH
jgi:phosphoglycerol transferase MdoB-like AlkP superfamily enzyme